MKNALLFVMVLLLNCPVQAADSLTVSQIGIDQGLSNNSVRCIYQDHNGYMWFGTYDGLNRYDGYAFKSFWNELKDSNSLPHNYIYSLYEDHLHHLWVGTGQGIGIYDPLTAHFSPAYYVSWKEKRKEKISIHVTAICGDAAGNRYIGTNGRGLLVQGAAANLAMQVPLQTDTGMLTDYNAQSCLIGKKQEVWVFIEQQGLFRYSPETKGLTAVNRSLKACLCMAVAANGDLFIGTTTGLYKFEQAQNSMKKMYVDAPGQLTSNVVACLFPDAEGQLWIGTEGGGIDILNTHTGQFSYLSPAKENSSLSSESVVSIYVDKEKRKWIGTLKGGINRIDPAKKRFQTYVHDPFHANSLVYDFVSSFFEEENGRLWIGTDGGGISIWDRSKNQFSQLVHHQSLPNSLANNQVNSIVKDYTGSIWMANYGEGISRYNETAQSFSRYHCMNPKTGEENKNTWLLLEDREKNLWATTFARGKLYRFNRPLDAFEMFDPDLTDLISLKEDLEGNLWAGNSFQLTKIDKVSKHHLVYEIGKPVRAIFEDQKHRLWLGTEGGGLVLFDRKAGKIAARYSNADGLCNNAVLNILEDRNGRLWLSTFYGLSRFDPETRIFKNFFRGDGLPSNQFLYNAALALRSGKLAFGSIKGFTVFDPDSLQYSKFTPPVLLTELRVNTQPVTISSSFVSASDSDAIRGIRVPYDEAVLSFDFAALEFSAPEKIAYAYYLEGWDKGWTYTNTIRTGTYTRLKEGSYKLHIKSTNAAGDWNPKEAILSVVVLPPWYRSIWAWLFYICLASGAVYLYLRYRTGKTKLEYEVKLAHLETEKEKELNEKKLSFFTDMSHEFRTPLTLIINPVKDMLDSEEKKKDPERLNIVYRNAKRLLSLADQLLLFRKADTAENQLRISKLNYSSLCKDVYHCFVQEARARQIAYTIECADNIYIFADCHKIEIALYNLLSNAIKYVPARGKIECLVTISGSDVITKVNDSGVGIPVESSDKIFDKFYQVSSQQTASKPGFGIGLSLVKNVAENHGGSIRYEAVPGEGVSFILTIPIGAAAQVIEFTGNEMPAQIIGGYTGPEFGLPDAEKLEELVSLSATLLVVDDNEQLRQYVAGIFSGMYKVYEAATADQGLVVAREQMPDLIISDIVMEGMSGMDFCETIKKDPALGHIPVILLSGSASPDGRLKGIEHGADDYITKPFEKDLLVARVANLLKNRSVLQNYFYNEITLQQNNLKVSAEYKLFLEKCIAVVEQHLDNETFSIKALARELGMSHSNLYKKVKSVSGQSVNAFIRFIRLRKAAELFINSNHNVNETALKVGFIDVKYFREQFHKLFGMNPSEYIRKYRKAFSSSYRVNKEAFADEEDL